MSGKKQYPYTHFHQPRLFADQDIASGLERNLDNLEVIFLSAQRDAQAIVDSTELTKPGKVNRLKELGEKVDGASKQWRAKIFYDKVIEEVESEMQPTPSRQDDVVAELRRREIRDHLKSLDPVLQESAYRAAAEKGNDLFLEAIETAPVPLEFATQKLIDKIKIQRLERQYPEAAAKLRDLTTARQQLDSALASFRHDLANSGLDLGVADLTPPLPA